jgi:hypothetical protein
MNWTKLAAAGFFALLNVAAVSAHADTRLDVKKVISTVEQGLPRFQRCAESARLQQVWRVRQSGQLMAQLTPTPSTVGTSGLAPTVRCRRG